MPERSNAKKRFLPNKSYEGLKIGNSSKMIENVQSSAHFQGEHGSPGLIGKKYGDGYFRGLTTQGVSPHPLGSVLIVLQSCCQTEFEADEENIAADHLQNIFFCKIKLSALF